MALFSALALVLVWLGYPLLVAAAAAVLTRRRRSAPRAVLPSVSVVLATRESAEQVQARVADLLHAAYPTDRLEVVIALDATAKGVCAADLTGLDARVRVVRGDAPGGKAAALNAGVRAATGEVLVFTDTHQRFDPQAIPRLVAALADARVGAASGRLVLRDDNTGRRSLVERYWAMERRLRRDEARIHSAVGVSGSIYALRHALWQPLPAGLILDDLYVPMRVVLAGQRVGFVDDAFAFETRRPAIAHEYRRKVRTLTGNLQLCAWLPAVLVPVRNPIWLQFMCHKLLRLVTPYWLLAIAAWAAAAVWRALGEHAPAAALALAAVALAMLFVEARPARSLRSLLYQGAMLQAAVVTATFNGLRGRWDVWHH